MTLARMTLAALAVAGSLLVPSAPAQAVDAFVTIGTGVISPGLPTTGCRQQDFVGYYSTLTVAGGDHAGIYWFAFDGWSSICESVWASAGSGTLSGDLHGYLYYSRTGTVLTISAQIYFGDADHEGSQALAGWCDWAPTTFDPVQSYVMACRFVLT